MQDQKVVEERRTNVKFQMDLIDKALAMADATDTTTDFAHAARTERARLAATYNALIWVLE